MQYDLIIVGTGFASSFFLRRYLDKCGPKARILVLERGYYHPHAERMQVDRGSGAFQQSKVEDREAIDNENPEKPWTYDLSFGGSSNCWWACTPRFLPADFELHTRYGQGTDWPLSYDELEPYYCQAEEIMHVSGPDKTPFPRSRPYPLPAHTFNAADRILHQQYGDHYIVQPAARARIAREGVAACCNSARCELCPVNAKFTIENSLSEIYRDSRVSCVYGAQAFALDTAADTVRQVHYIWEGKQMRAEGEVVALGGNAIFNPHILLNSGDDNVFTGAGLCEQVSRMARIYLRDLDNTGSSTVISANGYMLYDGPGRREEAACLIESINHPFAIRPERGKWLKVATFKFIFEDLLQAGNRVRVTEDPLKPQVVYQGFSEYARRGLERLEEKLPRIFACLPVEKIEINPEVSKTESHLLGTTRMSREPDKGVIDRYLIHHRWRNLLVLGGGAFPAISPANPTLTLSALSLWAADRVMGST